MGQTEGKSVPHQNAEAAEPPPTSPNIPVPTSTQHSEDTPQDDTNKNENLSSTPNTNTPPNDGRVAAVKTNTGLKRSTDELVGGINKLGANLISTAKGAVPYTSYSMNAFKKAASAAVEDAIVTVKAGIVRTEEEPELDAVAKMPLFFPLIRSSVPISDLAKGLPVQKTTIAYLDPKSILVSLLDYQRFLIVTSKMIAGRQAEVSNKVKEVEMSSGRKTVFTLAMKVTDMRHFNTQFSEVSRFHSNMERTKQSINDILGMFEKLNAILPAEHQLESFPVFAASNPTLSPSHSSGKYSLPPSPHSSINFASLNLPSSHSSGSFALPSSHSSGSLANYILPSSHSSGSLANYNLPASHSSGKFSSLNPPASHSSMKFSAPAANSTTSNTTNPNTTTNTDTTTHTTNTPNKDTTATGATNSDSTSPDSTNLNPTNPDSSNANPTNLDSTNTLDTTLTSEEAK